MKHIENLVASAIDDNYVWPLLVMLNSAKTTGSYPFSFVLGFDGRTLSKNNLELIENVCKIWKIEITAVQISFDVTVEPGSHLTSATYSRLLLADSLESCFMWIDADVLCQKGWDDYFEIGRKSEEKSIVIAVRDPLVQFGVPNSQLENSSVKLAGEQYFNAGVILLKPNKWKLHNSPEKWRLAFENASSLGFQFHDQCILNYVLAGYSELIPSEYNYLVRNDNERLIKNPKVIHFAGGFKPWHMPEIALWIVAPKLHRDLYRKYARFQYQVFISTFVQDPVLAKLLWKERLRLRRSDNFLQIVRQKKDWWVSAQKIRIFKVFRKIWGISTKLPVVNFLWSRHLESIDIHTNSLISEIVRTHKLEIQAITNQYQDERPQEIRELESIAFGSYETFYSQPPSDLAFLFDKYGSDKGTLGNPSVEFSWRSHNYSDLYSEIFHDRREQVLRVFECGIGTNNESFKSNMTSIAKPGGSLRAWRDYFPNAIIYGADIDSDILFIEDRIKTGYLDQLDSESIKEYFSSHTLDTFDIMIDDGLHTFEAAINLLVNSIGYLRSEGTYFIEDVHYPDVLKYEEYLKSNNYDYRIVSIKRKEHVLGDNIMILIKRQ